MARKFNVTGACNPKRHYMVDIIDYLGKQIVCELKIWRGNAYNERGEQQISDYLDYYHLDTGYMLSFCFNKNKKIGVHEVMVGEKTLVEAVV